MRKLRYLMVALFAILLFSGICNAGEDEIVKEFKDTRTVKPGRFTEKCLTLRPKQVFDYKFESSSPVYFNIHYHGELGREYFVERNAISSYEATLTEFRYKKAYKGMSKKASICMLWKNNTDEPVDITIDCEVTKK